MKKLGIIALLITCALMLAAEDAVVKSVKGKVEYSSDGIVWLPAEPTQTLTKGDYISTSFKSSAVIVVNGSIINVKALTRMSLDELTKTAEGPQTELYLVSGKVSVEVKPSTNNEVTTFKVKSAMATASVRGTGFEFDGENLLVNHGAVQLMDSIGVSRSVNGGEFGNAGKRGKMPEPVAVKKPAAPVITAESTVEEVEAAAETIAEEPIINVPDVLATLSSEIVEDTGSSVKEEEPLPEPVVPVVTPAVVTITIQ